MKRLALLIFAASLCAQTTWDLSEHFGVQTIAQSVELPYTAGLIAPNTKRLIGPLGEVPFAQLRNGSLLFRQPVRRASIKGLSYNANAGLVRLASECAPDGAYNARALWASSTTGVVEVGDILMPRGIGAGVVSTNVTAGSYYYVVAIEAAACSTYPGAIDVSATPGGSPVSVTDRGSGGGDYLTWDWIKVGATWDAGNGLRIHGTFVDADPVRFACAGSCTLPTGLSASTTYYLDLISTDVYDVYSDSSLTTLVPVTAGGTGPNEVISYWGYTLENTAPSAAVTNPVVLGGDANYHDITNGLTGLRIPKTNAGCSRAPIQGIRLADGTWTAAANPNSLYLDTGTTYPQTTLAAGIDTCTLYWDEMSPLVISGRIVYVDTGVGELTFQFWVYANQKFITVETDQTLNASLYLQLPAAFDTARFRDMSTGVVDIEATLLTTMDYRLASWGIFDTATTDPRAVRYAHLYQAAGGSTTPMIALLGGWIDRNINLGRANVRHVTFETAHPATGGAGTYLSLGINKGNSTSQMRRRAAIYVGTKADIPAPLGTMSDAALNYFQIAAAPSLSDLLTSQYAAPDDPGGGWPYPFLSASEGSSLVTSMRAADITAYNALMVTLSDDAVDQFGRHVVQGWRANDLSGPRQASWQSRDDLYRSVKDMLTLQGNMAGLRNYYELFYSPMVRLGGVLAALQDSNAIAYDKAEAKRVLGFWCGWAWDQNWAPIDSYATIGDNFGLQNQLTQAFLQRQIFTTYCRSQPFVSALYIGAEGATRGTTFPLWYDRYADSSGVNHNGTNYIEVSVGQLQNAYSAMRSFGTTLTVAENTLFANQVLQHEAMMTPPDSRFSASGTRVSVVSGDATYSRPIILGSTAKFIADTGLKWLWSNALSQAASSFFLPALYNYDWSSVVASTERTLVNRFLPKYGASLRSAYGTVNESLAFHIHGPAFDHMHGTDDGSFQFWALKAPVATLYNNHFGPSLFDRRIKNGIMLDTEKDWTLDNSTTTDCGTALCTTYYTSDPTTTIYLSGAHVSASASDQARAGGPTWSRKVVMIGVNAAKPIFATFDTFSGTGSSDAKVLFYNHHATGNFTCPTSGTCTPTVRDYTISSTNFPSASASVAITQDAANAYLFTGAGWTNNPSGIIDWDWIVNPGGASPLYNYGNWCAPLQGGSAQALYGASPKECQHIVRVRATGSVAAFWLPYAKASTPSRTITSPSAQTLRVVDGAETINVTATQYDYTNGTIKALAAFDTASHTAHGMTVVGCPQEAVYNGTDTVTWKVTALTACTATLTPPAGTWYADKPVGLSGANFVVYHPGGAQPGTTTIVLSTTVATRRALTRLYRVPSGASQVRIRFGSTTEYVALAACSPVCSVALSVPTGAQSTSHQFLDAGGLVVAESVASTITVN